MRGTRCPWRFSRSILAFVSVAIEGAKDVEFVKGAESAEGVEVTEVVANVFVAIVEVVATVFVAVVAAAPCSFSAFSFASFT